MTIGQGEQAAGPGGALAAGGEAAVGGGGGASLGEGKPAQGGGELEEAGHQPHRQLQCGGWRAEVADFSHLGQIMS